MLEFIISDQVFGWRFQSPASFYLGISQRLFKAEMWHGCGVFSSHYTGGVWLSQTFYFKTQDTACSSLLHTGRESLALSQVIKYNLEIMPNPNEIQPPLLLQYS
jgi:hypothetical protein